MPLAGVAARTIAYSGYPGDLFSGDDFYITSRCGFACALRVRMTVSPCLWEVLTGIASKLGVMETTGPQYNASLYQYITGSCSISSRSCMFI
jgi:hypothetical protein